jgi:hypothetical protein
MAALYVIVIWFKSLPRQIQALTALAIRLAQSTVYLKSIKM